MMKPPKILLLFAVILFCQLVSAQQKNDPFEKWNYLIGDWIGEGNGQPGNGEGKFTIEKDLDGKVLVRKNHTVFPATSNSQERVHDDMLIVYSGAMNNQQEAIYFDNEGNTIKYKVSFNDKSIILTSDISTSAPRFRFTYTFIDAKTANASFEMASPQAPEEFKMYLQGKVLKVK